MNNIILQIRELSKGYSTRQNQFNQLLTNVSLDVREGDWISIGGPSGSGKTTFLKLLCQELTPDNGNILYKSDLRLNDICYIPQDPIIYPFLTIIENLFDVNKDFNKVNSILNLFGISHIKTNYHDEISSGELTRVAFARALISEPKLILIDEPTASLDKRNVRNIIDILKLIESQGLTQIITSHSVEILNCAIRKFQISNTNLVEY